MSEPSGTTPRLLRQLNARKVLSVLSAGAPLTSTELMAAAGLTRATVHAVCQELIDLGWVLEPTDRRTTGGYQKGRPSRYFQFNDRAGYVLGIDVGASKTTAVVADLRGQVLGRSRLPFAAVRIPAAERVDTVDRAARSALDSAGVPVASVLAVTVGVAAPVDRDGSIAVSDQFWRIFDIDLGTALRDRHGWVVQLENDANLAALAERWQGVAEGVDDLAVLLASERIGAGLMESGRLLHGRRGGAGELAFLRLLEGVGTVDGIAFLARKWGTEAVARDERPSVLAGNVTAESVFAAAADGDQVALDILDRLCTRMARIIAAVSDLLNPELVVIAGAVADAAGVLLETITARLPTFANNPPRVAVSTLGNAVVAIGAVRHALDYVEANRLAISPAPGQKPLSAGEPYTR
jgi:predicted NBD/HSP70 family sugar kinase